MSDILRRALLSMIVLCASACALGQTPPQPPPDSDKPPESQAEVLSLPPVRLPAPPVIAPSVPSPDMSSGATVPDAPNAPTVLTLKYLEDMALESHPTFREAAAAVEAARGRSVQAGLRLNPTISYEGTDIGEDGHAGKHGGFISQEFNTAAKRWIAQGAADRAVDQRELQLATARQRVLGDVRASYYSVVFSQRRIVISRGLVKIAESAVDISRRRLEAREVSAVDLLQAQTEGRQEDLRLSEALHGYQAAWRRLAAVVSGGRLAPVDLVDEVPAELPHLQWAEAVARLLENSPELAAANAGVDRARCELRLAEARRYPNFEMKGGVAHNYFTGETEAAAALSMPLQLYNRNQGAILEAEARVVAAQRDVERIEWNLRRRLAASFEQYDIAMSRAQQYAEQILPQTKKAMDLIERGYRQGEFRYDELLIAQRNLVRANLDNVAALEQVWQSNSLIDNLLLSDSLEPLADAP